MNKEDLTPEDCGTIEETHELIEEATEFMEEATRILQERDEEIKELKKQLDYGDIEIKRLRRMATMYQQACKNFVNIILEYGNHKSSCNFSELRQVGRMMDESEEELCTCSWSKRKIAMENAKEGKDE